MTIPGKGGRPRKWRSDADRVRAYRARQRGEPEPSVLAVTLDQGDELTEAWERIRLLGHQLDERKEVEQSLRKELRAARRGLEAQRRQFGWIIAQNSDLRTRLAEVEEEVEDLREQYASLTDENLAMRRTVETWLSESKQPSVGQQGNRAQRRLEARKARQGS